MIAAVRDPQIGTDVNVYIKPVIETISKKETDLFTLLHNEIFVEETNGIFFTCLLYLCSKSTNMLGIALFIMEFLCLFPVYKAIQKQEFSSGSKVLSLFCYYCLFYHLSLNLMKQCAAVAITLWGFDLIKKQRKWRYFFLVFLTAFLVHKTALLALLVYILYILTTDPKSLLYHRYFRLRIKSEKKSSRRFKFFVFIMLITALVFVLLKIRVFLEVLVRFKHSYIYQLSHLQNFELKYSNLLIMILILMPVILFRKKAIITEPKYRFYFYILVISALLYQFVGVSPALYRLSLYTLILIIYAVPEFVGLFKKDARILAAGYYILVLVVDFVFEVILNSYADVYPYITAF